MLPNTKEMSRFEPHLEYGQLISEIDGNFWVDGPMGRLKARPAVSCLVKPRIGDRVLLSVDEAGQVFILAVLERDERTGSSVELAFAGPVSLETKDELTIIGWTNVTVTAGYDFNLAATRMEIHANEGQAAIERLSIIGRVIKGQFKRVKLVAIEVENIFRQLTQRLKNNYRYVAEHEEVQAGSHRYLVEDTLTTQTKNTVHMAEEIVKINAGQIHLG